MTTLAEILQAGLEARGYSVDRAYMARYGAKRLPFRKAGAGKRYFVGKAGALRVGQSASTSRPSGLRDAILAEGQAELARRKGRAQRAPELTLEDLS